jgi:ribosomal protein S18 acetylase RimI-like enzyme
MCIYRRMEQEDIVEVAKFIARMNQTKESHIGYCGTNGEEIAHSLKEDVSDIPYWESFILAHENQQLIGVLGFDADLEANCVEVWGPFIDENKWAVASAMWQEMMKYLPEDIERVNLFPNKKNDHYVKFAQELGFPVHSEQTILTFYKDNCKSLEDIPIVELTVDFHSEFEKLHDHTFPETYYSGKQIVEQIGEHNKVFMTIEDGQLSGYIYVEAEPEFGEASIEFFAVNEKYRGRGIGGELLTIALQWLFSFEQIDSITLCVDSKNDKAIGLYQKIGFERIYDLLFMTKKLRLRGGQLD